MSARRKLNGAHFSGAVIVAGLVGAFTESWLGFWMAGAVLIAAALLSGEIRPHRRGSRK